MKDHLLEFPRIVAIADILVHSAYHVQKKIKGCWAERLLVAQAISSASHDGRHYARESGKVVSNYDCWIC